MFTMIIGKNDNFVNRENPNLSSNAILPCMGEVRCIVLFPDKVNPILPTF